MKKTRRRTPPRAKNPAVTKTKTRTSALAPAITEEETIRRDPVRLAGVITKVFESGGLVVVSPLISLIASYAVLITPNVRTIAGCGKAGTSDGVGSAAEFSHPVSVSFCDADTVLVADGNTGRVRRVGLRDGSVKTIAGAGYSLDGQPTVSMMTGPALSCQFTDLTVVCVDPRHPASCYYLATRTAVLYCNSEGLIRLIAGRRQQTEKPNRVQPTPLIGEEACFHAIFGMCVYPSPPAAAAATHQNSADVKTDSSGSGDRLLVVDFGNHSAVCIDVDQRKCVQVICGNSVSESDGVYPHGSIHAPRSCAFSKLSSDHDRIAYITAYRSIRRFDTATCTLGVGLLWLMYC